MRRVPGVKLTLLHQRVKFNLVYHRRDAGFIDQLLQMMNLEITDADAFASPCCCSSISFSRRRRNGRCRNRPVHEVEIDIVELQFFRLSCSASGVFDRHSTVSW
jgi:hypothetical protein